MSVLESWVQTPGAMALGWTLIHSLWEGAVVALVLAGALCVLRGSRARYGAACLALLVLLAGFGVTFAAFDGKRAEPEFHAHGADPVGTGGGRGRDSGAAGEFAGSSRVPAVDRTFLDRGSSDFSRSHAGGVDGRAAAAAYRDLLRAGAVAGTAGTAGGATGDWCSGDALGKLPGRRAAGDRIYASRNSDTGRAAGGSAGGAGGSAAAARAGPHTALRLSGQSAADFRGGPDFLSSRGLVDGRGNSCRARKLLR